MYVCIYNHPALLKDIRSGEERSPILLKISTCFSFPFPYHIPGNRLDQPPFFRKLRFCFPLQVTLLHIHMQTITMLSVPGEGDPLMPVLIIIVVVMLIMSKRIGCIHRGNPLAIV